MKRKEFSYTELVECVLCRAGILHDFIKIVDNEPRCPECEDILVEELYNENNRGGRDRSMF